MPAKMSFFKRRKKALIIAGVLLFLGIIFLFNLRSGRENPVKVNVEKLSRRNLTSIISASGEIRPRKSVNISAHLPGRIVSIGVREGQRVKEGDFLLKLDSTQYEANADRDRAIIRFYRTELEKTRVKRDQDRATHERQEQLFAGQLISREQMEAAKVQYDISRAQHDSILHQVEQSEASLRVTLDALGKTVFRAPLDGVVTSLRVEEGEVAIIGTMNNPGTVLMTIADLSIIEVEVQVDETDVIAVRLDQTAEVHVDALPGRVLAGRVTEVGSSALQRLGAVSATTQESKDFKVVVTLDEPPPNLRPGLSATADIITAEKQSVLAVPIAALVLRERPEELSERKSRSRAEEEGVFVVGKDNKTAFVPVLKGIAGDLMIEIVSGPEEGAEVVVGPYGALRQLKDGTLIKPEKPAAKTPS
ncbi:MAG: efflux RND transporter periplasmic adaptor subunit [Candidatus Aminicenantes bacterium]|nr:efflux RND transporter periplasmic adaptor subunit [Candidatus Aminicenantes bacterium]